jgi:hypothetical protein
MIRFLVTCPRCQYVMDYAQTKLKAGDLVQCLKCKLNIKVTKITLPRNNGKDEIEQKVGVEPLVTNGVEIESYLIKDDIILEKAYVLPIEDVIEPGEAFTDDMTIGNEYISPVFDDINEGLFLLKNGLRKYRVFLEERAEHQIGLFGTWLSDPAGTHMHVALGEEGIKKEIARELMVYIHDYLPLIIALCVNSPVFPSRVKQRPRLTSHPSNRLLNYASEHCKSISKEEIREMRSNHWVEINYNALKARTDKPPTIEIRLPDSNIPEFIIAGVEVLRVLTIACLSGKESPNQLSFQNYQKAKRSAIRYGVRGQLYWDNYKVKTSTYIDKFFDEFSEEIEKEDPIDEILDIFRLAKLGWTNADIMAESINYIRSVYSSKKFNWRKQFLRQYTEALAALLDGNRLGDYANLLYVDLPEVDDVLLGRENPI